MSAILTLDKINYGYIDGGYRREILKDLSYQFEEGTFYTILGPSGSGKTTLLSIMAGLDKQESGNIYYDGENIETKGLYDYRRNKVGVVFQSYNLITYMTAIQNVLTAMEITCVKVKNKKARALELLEKVGLTEVEAKRNVLQLSGGQKQIINYLKIIRKLRMRY